MSSVTFAGSTSGSVQIIPAAVAGVGTVLTLPATTGTVVTTGDTGTVTSTMIADGTIVNNDISSSAAIAVSKLAASTISGVTLGNNLNTLTIGSGLSGTSYNGSASVTIAIDSTVALRADTQYIGTTAVALNRSSGNLALTGITAVTLPGATSGSVQIIPAAVAGTGTVLTLPATTGTVVTTGDTGTVTNTMLAGSITNAKLVNSSVTVGTTSISLGASSTTLAGLTSVTSTSFTGALTGNASTASALATARTINGVSFDGSANITVTAAAGTLTGTSLNSTVVSSSLTSVGTISSGTWQGTVVDVAYGGTGTNSGSITGTGALTFTAGGSNTNVNLVPQGTGTVDVGNKRITSVAEPTQATDAATKNYVDAVKTGLDVKDSVRVASTAALTVTYNNGTSGVGATLTNAGTQAALTLDTIVLSSGDRVLIKDQASGLQNGIYTVTNVGSASTNWVLTRATDTDSNTPVVEVGPGMFTFVEEGSVNADNGFVCTNNGTITIGTTAITWVQFSGAGQITAGNGLTKNGNTIDVVGTSGRISVTADAIDIDSTYIGQTTITTLGTITTGTWSANTIVETKGGTGNTSYAKGDILYASAANTLSKLSAGADGTVLQMNASGVPVWATLDGGTY